MTNEHGALTIVYTFHFYTPCILSPYPSFPSRQYYRDLPDRSLFFRPNKKRMMIHVGSQQLWRRLEQRKCLVQNEHTFQYYYEHKLLSIRIIFLVSAAVHPVG